MEKSSPAYASPIAFFAWSYGVVGVLLAAFVLRAWPESPRAWGFAAAVVLSYALLYSLPVLLAAWACGPLLRRAGAGNRFAGGAVVVAVATTLQLVLAADYTIHGMFGFHINGFVINLVLTPEGVASMGADPGAGRVYLLIAFAIVALNACVWCALTSGPASRWMRRGLTGCRLMLAVGVVIVGAVAERVTYGLSHLQGRPDVMAVAAAIPGYQPTTFRSLAKRFGIEMKRSASVDAPRADAALAYPARPLETTSPAKPVNIVMLVCESLRTDMLTPEIMPKTWAFAQEGQRFTRHYSGGNGTRMGMFSLFYGLPGSYWFNVLGKRRAPVLIDRVQALDYRLHLSTSAAFSYPEFDKTIFARVPADQLHAESKGEGWKSDRHHVGLIKDWLAETHGPEPFFLFHFFESPHARYYFPPESVIRRPYLEDFNYATVNLRRDIGLIRARYINAVHHLDSQLGEVLDALRASNRLEDTVVIITGDHGEEFLENGHWGHNSEFTEAQVRVPLVLRVPGRAPEVVEHATSHVDLVPTLLPLLGVTNPPEDYAVGTPLFDPSPRLLTFADWDRIAFDDGRYKAVFPLGAGGQLTSRVTTSDDRAVADEGEALRRSGESMMRLMGLMRRFTQDGRGVRTGPVNKN